MLSEFLNLFKTGGFPFLDKLKGLSLATDFTFEHLSPERMEPAVVKLVTNMIKLGSQVMLISGSPQILEGKQMIAIGVIFNEVQPLDGTECQQCALQSPGADPVDQKPGPAALSQNTEG